MPHSQTSLSRLIILVFRQVCDEVELIVETGVKCSEQLLAKVMNLSARLESIEEMKRNIDKLDATLLRYETIADALIKRRQKTRHAAKLKEISAE